MLEEVNEKLVLKNEEDIKQADVSISEFFKQQRKELQIQAGTGKRRDFYPLKIIATNLGISKDMLEGKLYRKPGKPLTRDWIIAISAAHGMNSWTTNDALLLCDYPQLDTDLPRDDCIIEFLEHNEGQANTLAEMNRALIDMGHAPLCTERKTKPKSVGESKIVRRTIRTYVRRGEEYDSLETAYPSYDCYAYGLVHNGEQDDYYLETSTTGWLAMYHNDDILPQIYKSIDEIQKYKDEFIDLLSYANRMQRRANKQLLDTKNYKERLGANLLHDRIHVFYEMYNYSSPVRNEYYMMELVDGHLRLSISHQSMFMHEYLSEKDYKYLYGTQAKEKRTIYNSIEEIETLIKENHNSYYEDVFQERKRAFNRMLSKVINTAQEIKNKTLFIRNLSNIYDNPGDVCSFFHVEKEFDCSFDNDYGEIEVGKNSADVFIDGEQITITFSELKRAFELGYVDWGQIIRIKKEKGSIENIF